MRVNDTDFGINSTISIFPQEFQDDLSYITATSTYGITNVTTTNGSSTGIVDFLAASDFFTMTFTSNITSLEVIINFNMTVFMSYFINPYNITLLSSVNASVEQLDIEVLNHYTKSYDKLGDLNSSIGAFPLALSNSNFTFNQQMPPFAYINQSNLMMRLRISGQNSTYDSDYELSLDMLGILVTNSTKPLIAPHFTWPKFKVIGIIKDPTLAVTERAMWSAEVEKYYDTEFATNTIYINYEDARNLIYPHRNGTLNNGTYDLVTYVLIHCNNIENIETIYNQLKQQLANLNGTWTAMDFKTPLLDSRRYVNDWYVWIEEGEIDEEILEELIEYIEDKGYVVLFGFTRTFVEDMFRGMINLIVMITTGILTFAIIISMIGLALHSLLSTMARRREIGMLRSIGLNKKGVIRTISGETIIISLLGALIGIVAGLLQGFLMVSSVPATGLIAFTFTIPWLIIGLLVGVTLITAIVSSRYPSRWAANINIIDAVRTR